MTTIQNILSLPRFYWHMKQITGKDADERYKQAQGIAAEYPDYQAYYIERKDYPASGAYLFLAKPR